MLVIVYLCVCLLYPILPYPKLPTALQALNLQARYYMNPSDESLIAQLQSMLGDGVDPATQLYAAQIFLQAGMKKEALQAVFGGRSLHQLSLASQIYLQLDRLDLAAKEYAKMQKIDEDSVLTQMTSVYIQLAKGSSGASDALHLLQQLSEQYGASVLLLNLTACALLQAGQYAQAEAKLNEAMQDFAEEAQKSPDTLVNLIVSQQYQQKPTTALVEQLQALYPNHFLVQGLTMVQGAFEREAVKYQVA